MHYNVIGEEEEERKRQAVISRQIAWQLVTFFRGYVAIDDWEIYKKWLGRTRTNISAIHLDKITIWTMFLSQDWRPHLGETYFIRVLGMLCREDGY